MRSEGKTASQGVKRGKRGQKERGKEEGKYGEVKG